MATPRPPSDVFVTCAAGHRHFGKFGAAGVLITDGARVVLQHRAPHTDQGGTWGIPGGARAADEDAVSAAFREANEEAGIAPGSLAPLGLYIVDHGGWSYTTVLARPRVAIEPRAMNGESLEVSWCNRARVRSMQLHRGFADAWQFLRNGFPPVTFVIEGATADQHAGLFELARRGMPADAPVEGGSVLLLPTFLLLGDPLISPPSPAHWWHAQVVSARRAEDVPLQADEQRVTMAPTWLAEQIAKLG